MASPSSPQKNADTPTVEAVAKLLRSGSQHDADRPEIAHAVQHLQSLGLVETTSAEYVRCAESRDRDYQYVRDRSCRGRIRLNDALDEDGDSFHCPECGRTVYPRHKRRFKMLQVDVKPDKVAAFLDGIVAASNLPRKQLQPWVWRVDTPQGEAKLVVVDYCGGQEAASRDWALNTRACYIVVDAANCKKRFLPEKWLAWVRLADIVCNPDLLPKLLSSAAETVPSPEARVSVPVYSATVPSVVITPPLDGKTPPPRKLKKRATRAAAIDAIKRALREHLRSARDHAYSSSDAALLPRPTLQQLADQLKVHISSVSRAINDPSDREIAILWDAANDIEKVMKFKS